MRGLTGVLLLGLAACHSNVALATVAPNLEVQVLDASVVVPAPHAVVSGALDARFGPFSYRDTRLRGGPFWLKLNSLDGLMPADVPALIVHKGRHLHVQLFTSRAGQALRLAKAAELPGFSGMHDAVFLLPSGLTPGQSLYVRVDPSGRGAEELRFSRSTLIRHWRAARNTRE